MWLALLVGLPLAAAAGPEQAHCPPPQQVERELARQHRSLADHRALVESLRALRRCAAPDHATVLARAFVGSRHGALAEDPDLFESALIGLRRLPADDARRGLVEGMLPQLLDHTWDDLHARWIEPALVAQHPELVEVVGAWAPRSAPALRAAEQAVSARLSEGLRADPEGLLGALSAHGGSLSHEAAADLRDALLAELGRSALPGLAALAAEIGVQSGHGGPRLRAALVEQLGTLPPAEQSAVRSVIEALPARAELGPLRPPASPPGQLAGLDWQPPSVPDSAAVWRPPAPLRLPRGALVFGLGLVGLLAAFGLRRRPPLAALAGGLGVLAACDGTLAAALPELGRLPELGLIPTPELRPTVEGESCWYGGPGTRLEAVPCRRDTGHPLVAVVGASSVHGSHYVAEQAFPARLQQRLGDRSARVLNLGIGGATSATLAGWAGRAGPLDAEGGGPVDVLVIYYGHNEAAQLAALSALGGRSATTLRARLWARQSGLYSVLSTALRPPPATGGAPPGHPPDPALLGALAAAQVRHNLGLLLGAARDAGAAAVVVLPATNLRFAHVERSEPGPDTLYAEAEALARQGQGAAAAALLQARIDGGTSPRELVSPVRTALIEVAAAHGAVVVDAQAAFLGRAPDGVSPSGLFWDDLHPSAAGHEVLAGLLAPVVGELLDEGASP